MDDLEYLLNLNGEIFPMDNGYWVKFEVHKIEQSEHMPHGIIWRITNENKNYQSWHNVKRRV